ncbi:LysR family transcriptional regulator [Geosporobacter ferrireducens]|uniref:HTH lysR-type domain-containing protein n=1 Tax=Geosporobacter ferrireducens TaxID=1424294 RepID=A0A1D8GEU7_9FIRM|nr:LysR family transcriptional regulator [Geosporobacter ferrireducens]AOT69408.1 hypothetical protein Gferi_07370 [Geosporobacter ferrireducens]MTI56518.1 LysR family transcriptional regulator [Geosporobacter ferrireducens]
MNIEYLKYFYEVATAKSISKVAVNFHISQPALSQQIQRLEEMLGYKLLNRSNKGVELTEAGQIVEKYARTLVKGYGNMLEDLKAISSNHATIRINSNVTLATYALPCTLYTVQQNFPELLFNLASAFSNQVEQNVLNDVCDVGFIYGKPEDKDLSYAKVGAEQLIVVASEGFNIRQDVCLKDLISYPLFMLNNIHREQKQINRYLMDLGYNLDHFNISLSLDSIESLKSAVIKGYGLAIVPYISAKKEIYTKQLKQIYIGDFDMKQDIYILYKKEKLHNSSVKAFIQYIKKIGEQSFC